MPIWVSRAYLGKSYYLPFPPLPPPSVYTPRGVAYGIYHTGLFSARIEFRVLAYWLEGSRVLVPFGCLMATKPAVFQFFAGWFSAQSFVVCVLSSCFMWLVFFQRPGLKAGKAQSLSLSLSHVRNIILG